MALDKPSSIKKSEFRSAKWDEITKGRDFKPSDAPVLSLLCYWYEVLETCMDDLDYDGEMQVAYANKIGDVKQMPQISTMKTASSEIRALNKQLGINDESNVDEKPKKEAKVYVFQQKRQAKAKNSA